MKTRTLISGGVLAVAAVIGGNEAQFQLERQAAVAEFKQDPMAETAKRKVGEEIKSLRTENSETFKADSLLVMRPEGMKKIAQLNSKIYAGQKYWKDADVDTLRPIDLTVHEISALAKLNPLRTHDFYVDAAPYTARWMNGLPHDYRIDVGDTYVKYRALFDVKTAPVTVQATASGMKEDILLVDDKAPHELRWIIETSGSLVAGARNEFKVRASDGTFPMEIAPPVAFDAAGKPVMAVASVKGDTLTFKLTVLPGQEFPLTVDPTTTVTLIAAESGYVTDGSTTYLNVRNGNGSSGSPITSSVIAIGQVYSDPNYTMYRSYIHFAIPEMIASSACTLYANGGGDFTDTDWTLHIYGARKYRSVLTKDDWVNFSNWAASGTYDSSKVMNESWHTSSYSADWNKIIFNSTGLDSVKAAAGDTLWFALLSNRDVRADEPTGDERLYFERTGNVPYLSFTYTVPSINPPTAFFMSPITGARDSLLLSWTKNYSDNVDSLVLYQWPDSVRIATLTKTSTSLRRGGLTPYTRYRWYVRADSAGVYGYSNVDSCWTTQTFKTENFNLLVYGYVQNNATAVYDSARGETVADSLASGSTYLGQTKDGIAGAGKYLIMRHWANVIIPKLIKVQAESLFISGLEDSTTTDFSIVARAGKWRGGTAQDDYYFSFDGWQTQMTPYTGSPLTVSYSTSGFTTGATLNKLVFTQAGRDTTQKYGSSGADTLRFMLLSSKDVSATAPTNAEFVTFSPADSYLRLTYAPPDSAANTVTITAISTDSLLVSWNDRSYSERGFIVVDAVAGTIIAGTDTTNQDIESLRIGGLLPNTSYTWKVKAVGGGADGLLSAADSCYTKAATLGKPTVTMLTDSLRKIVIDTTGIYTSFTRIAIQDSVTGKFVDWISGATDTLHATADSSNADYRTFANWGGANGDTVRYSVGSTSVFRIWTISAQ